MKVVRAENPPLHFWVLCCLRVVCPWFDDLIVVGGHHEEISAMRDHKPLLPTGGAT